MSSFQGTDLVNYVMTKAVHFHFHFNSINVLKALFSVLSDQPRFGLQAVNQKNFKQDELLPSKQQKNDFLSYFPSSSFFSPPPLSLSLFHTSHRHTPYTLHTNKDTQKFTQTRTRTLIFFTLESIFSIFESSLLVC